MANLSGIGGAEVSDYRAYVIGDDGHIASSRAFVCDSDADATIWAKQMVDGHDIELWSGDRLVIRLNGDKRGSVSRDVTAGRLVPKK